MKGRGREESEGEGCERWRREGRGVKEVKGGYCGLLYALCALLGLRFPLLLRVNFRLLQLLLYLTDDTFDHHPVRAREGEKGKGEEREMRRGRDGGGGWRKMERKKGK